MLFLSVVLKCHNILVKMEREMFSGLSAKACYVKSYALRLQVYLPTKARRRAISYSIENKLYPLTTDVSFFK